LHIRSIEFTHSEEASELLSEAITHKIIPEDSIEELVSKLVSLLKEEGITMIARRAFESLRLLLKEQRYGQTVGRLIQEDIAVLYEVCMGREYVDGEMLENILCLCALMIKN
jgi:hypothetical protein